MLNTKGDKWWPTIFPPFTTPPGSAPYFIPMQPGLRPKRPPAVSRRQQMISDGSTCWLLICKLIFAMTMARSTFPEHRMTFAAWRSLFTNMGNGSLPFLAPLIPTCHSRFFTRPGGQMNPATTLPHSPLSHRRIWKQANGGRWSLPHGQNLMLKGWRRA